jgi:cytidylate kinase
MKTQIKRITLSGYAGTGKSTVGRMLAEKLGCKYFSAGDATRKFAEETYGMSINEFQAKCDECPELDISLNHNFRDICNGAESIVADFRLGFHLVENAFNILFVVSEQEAFERLSTSGRRMEQTDFESIRKRNEDMRNRFIERFGVDFADESNFDLTIDTGRKTVDETTAQILAAIRNWPGR